MSEQKLTNKKQTNHTKKTLHNSQNALQLLHP